MYQRIRRSQQCVQHCLDQQCQVHNTTNLPVNRSILSKVDQNEFTETTGVVVVYSFSITEGLQHTERIYSTAQVQKFTLLTTYSSTYNNLIKQDVRLTVVNRIIVFVVCIASTQYSRLYSISTSKSTTVILVVMIFLVDL